MATMPPGNLVGGNLVTPDQASVLTVTEIAPNLIPVPGVRVGVDTDRNQDYVQFSTGEKIGRRMTYTVGRQGSGCDVICDGVADQVEINEALLFAHNNNNFTGWKLEFSDDTFHISSPILRQSYVSMVGQGSRTTQFVADAGLTGGMQQLVPGAIQFLDDQGYRMVGGSAGNVNNAGCFAMQFIAQPLAAQGNAGGLWNSTFKDIQIDFFDNGIQSIGTLDASALLPQQFINFKDVDINLEGNTGYVVDCRGQHGQIVWDSCTLQNRVSTNRLGTLIRLGVSTDTVYPGDQRFINGCTFQNARRAFDIYGAKGIHIIGNWFENVAESVRVDGSSTGNSFVKCHLSNAGSVGDGNGYLAYVGQASSQVFRDNLILGVWDTGVIGNNVLFVDEGANTLLSTAIVGRSSGVNKQLAAVTSSTLTTGHTEFPSLQCSATTISNITAELLPNQELSIRLTANGGQTTQAFDNSSNIDLAGRTSPLTVSAGAVVTFKVSDLVARRFVLKSVSTG